MVNARLRYGIPAVALVLISVGAVLLAAHTNPAHLGAASTAPQQLPDTPGDTPGGPLGGATGWINSPPLGAGDLSGKVVLYDFWTYSCVNCVRTLPYLRAWYDRYARDGLVLVGVHSPEFDFEHVRSNVEAATRRLGVTWPVALDNDKAIWNLFNNAYWPADYVADRDGHFRYKHIGEGGYKETEDLLRNLLGVDASSPRAAVPGGSEDSAAVANDNTTPETYLGIQRSTDGARPGLNTYPEPGPLRSGDARLAGRWMADPEKVTAADPGAAIVLAYRANEVNLVMTPPSGQPVDVEVELDGHPLPGPFRTGDTVADDRGATVVHVDHDGLYRLLRSPDVEEHTVRLTARQPGVSAFAFTFGP